MLTIKDWSRPNKMHINYDKTNYMVLGTAHKLNNSHQFDLRIDYKPIKNTHNQILLGIYIDDKLSWCAHVDCLCSAVSSKISLLRPLTRYVPINVQKEFYQGYILPLLDYGSVLWGGYFLNELRQDNQTPKTRSPYNTLCWF